MKKLVDTQMQILKEHEAQILSDIETTESLSSLKFVPSDYGWPDVETYRYRIEQDIINRVNNSMEQAAAASSDKKIDQLYAIYESFCERATELFNNK